MGWLFLLLLGNQPLTRTGMAQATLFLLGLALWLVGLVLMEAAMDRPGVWLWLALSLAALIARAFYPRKHP